MAMRALVLLGLQSVHTEHTGDTPCDLGHPLMLQTAGGTAAPASAPCRLAGTSCLRQSRSSSPSPQLSCPLQRKIPGMQRLVFVHLNWLGKQT